MKRPLSSVLSRKGRGRLGWEIYCMKTVLDAKQIKMAIEKMANAIVDSGVALDKVALVGIRTRGVPLAQRIAAEIKKSHKVDLPVSILDITLYRDDLSKLDYHPVVKKTEIPYSIDAKVIYLVDDVLYTGRTVRCALGALFDLGRPDMIHLAVLVDRDGRELPIQGDIVGLHYAALPDENVKVKLTETDGVDEVHVEERKKK